MNVNAIIPSVKQGDEAAQNEQHHLTLGDEDPSLYKMGQNDLAGRGWAEIPSSILRAELERREDEGEKPKCGSSIHGAYNTSAHVLALFLILVLSTVACAFPLISRRTSKHRGPNNFVFISQHFGTGVLIATAFVHLLPTAFMSLTDPCLPYFWSRGYRPTAGLIAMTSALIVVAIEMFLTTRGAGHSHSHGWEEEDSSRLSSPTLGSSQGPYTQIGQQPELKKPSRSKPPSIYLHHSGSTENLVNGASPLMEFTPRIAETNNQDEHSDDGNESDLDLNELDPTEAQIVQSPQPEDLETLSRNGNPENQTPEQEEQRRQLLQCMLLEAGILFHSVFIGMAISVSTGTPFVIFLIAIAFHQSFEGLALGSRIAALSFPSTSPKPWLMVVAYGTTTPIGQAIGLIVRRYYDPQSETGLLMVGIMNAISSGLLIFAGLVQLLAEDFLSKKSYSVLKGKRRLKAFAAVIGGAALMALVGAWA